MIPLTLTTISVLSSHVLVFSSSSFFFGRGRGVRSSQKVLEAISGSQNPRTSVAMTSSLLSLAEYRMTDFDIHSTTMALSGSSLLLQAPDFQARRKMQQFRCTRRP